MKNRVYALCFSALLSLPSSLLAAPAPTTNTTASLNTLFSLRLESQRSLGHFYMLNSPEQDHRHATQAEDGVTSALENFKQLPSPTTPAAQTLQTQLQQELNTYTFELQRLIRTLQTQGYTDLQPVADLAQLNSDLLLTSQALEQQIMLDHQYQLPKLTQLAREQSILMQSIATDYAARSTSVGASFFAETEKQPLDKLSEQFSSNLLILQNNPKNSNSCNQLLRAIQVKWRYIEGSLKNYNKDSVPFVIDKYARSITQGFEQLAAEYALLNI